MLHHGDELWPGVLCITSQAQKSRYAKSVNWGGDLLETARNIFSESLAACSVEHAFRSKFTPANNGRPHAFHLRGGPQEPVADIDLAEVDNILIIAAGKGAAAMLRSLSERIKPPATCRVSGVLIAPVRPQDLPAGIAFFLGGHPLPTSESFRGAQAALAAIHRAAARPNPRRTFCFFLISGGASAMMELPLDDAISLEDTVTFHQALVLSGASIADINCVRKHFSAVKGGRLGQAAAPIPNLTILVSDVPANHLDALASGPTLPDSSTVSRCRDILARYRLLSKFPASAQTYFEAPHLPETPKPGSFPFQVVTLLSDADLAEAARAKAESLGFVAVVDTLCDDLDYRDAAHYLLQRTRTLRKDHPHICLISAGEVTVQVSRPAGSRSPSLGGRNQHFALYTATLLQPSDTPLVVLSVGSDGIDGNSPFAGAVLDSALLATGPHSLGAATEALVQFDSATLLHRLGATIETGPTGNNLRDLRLFLT